MNEIGLTVADLDGTLIHRRDEFDLYAPFRLTMEQLSERSGARWAINTGRGLANFKVVFRPMLSLGIRPDFVIVRHAYAYRLNDRCHYAPHLIWNVHIMAAILRERTVIRKFVRSCVHALTTRFRKVRVRSRSANRICLSFAEKNSAEAAGAMVRSMSEAHRSVLALEHESELVIQIVPSTKGVATKYIARHLRVPPEKVLTIGDGLNDISMFDRDVAAMIGCPANATPPVMLAVHDGGGHVSKRRGLAGTLDTIEAHRTGQTDSSLPADWPEKKVAHVVRSISLAQTTRSHSLWHSLKEPILLAAVLASFGLVLANYGLLGSLSGLVMKPFDLVIRAVTLLLYGV